MRERKLFNGYRASLWNDEKVLEMDGGHVCTTLKVFNATEFYT